MIKWKDAEGIEKPLHELEHDHLINIIKYLHRIYSGLEEMCKFKNIRSPNFESKPDCVRYLYSMIPIKNENFKTFKVDSSKFQKAYNYEYRYEDFDLPF